MAYHVHRLARLGPPMLISGNWYYSKKYHNSPMPYSIFFRGGYAIHGTGAVGALGRPASHGCIRLHTSNAAKLFAMVQREGASINISGSPGGQMIAKKKGKKNVAYAGRRTKANPLAYAPANRTKAPTVKQFQANPAGR